MPPLQHVGGSFAPAIDESKMAAYEALATSAGGRVGDEMKKLLAMVRAWWELPESTKPGSEHPAAPRAAVIPLEAEHVKTLWDLVPWPDELKLLSSVFDGVEQDVANRNGAAIDGWYASVRNAIIKKHFPEKGVYEKVLAVLKSIAEFLALFPATSELIQLRIKNEECSREIYSAFSSKNYPGIPYPVLEPTEMRDAAFHLLWFAGELTLDREPITMDKLA